MLTLLCVYQDFLGCLVLAIIAANWIAVYVAWKLIQ